MSGELKLKIAQLLSAPDDEHKFAGLLLLSRLQSESAEQDNKWMRDAYLQCGSAFFRRLLRSSESQARHIALHVMARVFVTQSQEALALALAFAPDAALLLPAAAETQSEEARDATQSAIMTLRAVAVAAAISGPVELNALRRVLPAHTLEVLANVAASAEDTFASECAAQCAELLCDTGDASVSSGVDDESDGEGDVDDGAATGDDICMLSHMALTRAAMRALTQFQRMQEEVSAQLPKRIVVETTESQAQEAEEAHEAQEAETPEAVDSVEEEEEKETEAAARQREQARQADRCQKQHALLALSRVFRVAFAALRLFIVDTSEAHNDKEVLKVLRQVLQSELQQRHVPSLLRAQTLLLCQLLLRHRRVEWLGEKGGDLLLLLFSVCVVDACVALGVGKQPSFGDKLDSESLRNTASVVALELCHWFLACLHEDDVLAALAQRSNTRVGVFDVLKHRAQDLFDTLSPCIRGMASATQEDTEQHRFLQMPVVRYLAVSLCAILLSDAYDDFVGHASDDDITDAMSKKPKNDRAEHETFDAALFKALRQVSAQWPADQRICLRNVTAQVLFDETLREQEQWSLRSPMERSEADRETLLWHAWQETQRQLGDIDVDSDWSLQSLSTLLAALDDVLQHVSLPLFQETSNADLFALALHPLLRSVASLPDDLAAVLDELLCDLSLRPHEDGFHVLLSRDPVEEARRFLPGLDNVLSQLKDRPDESEKPKKTKKAKKIQQQTTPMDEDIDAAFDTSVPGESADVFAAPVTDHAADHLVADSDDDDIPELEGLSDSESGGDKKDNEFYDDADSDVDEAFRV